MKVIFLDIDGVLVTGSFLLPSTAYHGYQFNPVCVNHLKQIMESTGAFIVVISSWRKAGFAYVQKMLAANGIGKGLVGITPTIPNGRRGDEIRQYIEESKLDPSYLVERFVILDDNDDMGNLSPYLVQTNSYTGLDQRAKERAIKLLEQD